MKKKNNILRNHPLNNILVRLERSNRDGLIDLFDYSMDRGIYAVTRFGKYYGLVDGSFNCYVDPPCHCTVMNLDQIIYIWDNRKNKVKGTWGGKRERKTKAEPTKVIRVPVSKLNAVYELINGKITTPHKMP